MEQGRILDREKKRSTYDDTEQRMYKSTDKRAEYTEDANEQRT